VQLGDSLVIETFTDVGSALIYQWNTAFNLNCDTCANPVAKPTKTYTYELRVTNAAGCTATDRITVYVDQNRQLYFPTAFSPNDDGFNDFFTLYGDDKIVTVNRFEIFNRWGALQFSATDDFTPNVESDGWNGTLRDRPVAGGVYVYQVEITFADGATETFAGEITLVR